MSSGFPYKLFIRCGCGCNLYYLTETHYSYNTMHRRWFDKEKGSQVVPFEKVFDSVPEEIQTQLLFHLDIFAPKD